MTDLTNAPLARTGEACANPGTAGLAAADAGAGSSRGEPVRRGPVQDESRSLDPLDRVAMRDIERGIAPAVVARPDSAVLRDLIAFAEDALRRNYPVPTPPELSRLVQEVTAAARRPTDLPRTIGDAESVLLCALREVVEHEASGMRHYRMREIAKHALALAREDLFLATQQENEVRP